MALIFSDLEAERVWRGERSRALPSDIQNVARRKLSQIDATTNLYDFCQQRGNRFEQLKGRTEARYSLRINDQWRICFDWADGDATNVRIEDYHRG